jgi:hypothetical protein
MIFVARALHVPIGRIDDTLGGYQNMRADDAEERQWLLKP